MPEIKTTPGELIQKDLEVSKRKLPEFLTRGVMILILIDTIFLILTFFFLGKFETLASELNGLRNKALDRTSTEDLSVLEYELEMSNSISERISNSFPNETGLLEFIDGVEKLKSPGTVTRISFASREPVKDKNGNLGIPVVIEFQGDWGAILTDIQKIQELPYVFKPVTFDSEKLEQQQKSEDGQTLSSQTKVVSFGGFLYVNEEFSKNR